MTRHSISKQLRFEVFKRDRFTCQYCGATAPDVLLEVDHINPVSKGGTNNIMNLVTACRNCNRGKTDKELSDDSAVKIQKQQLDVIQERRQQLELMLKWRDEIIREEEIFVDRINEIFVSETGYDLYEVCGEQCRQSVKRLIKRFGFIDVADAAEIAIAKYYNSRYSHTMIYALDKIGGICYNRKKARDEQNVSNKG